MTGKRDFFHVAVLPSQNSRSNITKGPGPRQANRVLSMVDSRRNRVEIFAVGWDYRADDHGSPVIIRTDPNFSEC